MNKQLVSKPTLAPALGASTIHPMARRLAGAFPVLVVVTLALATAHPTLAQNTVYPGEEISSWSYAYPEVELIKNVGGLTQAFYSEDSNKGEQLGITLFAAGKTPGPIGEKTQATESLHVDLSLSPTSVLVPVDPETGVPVDWNLGAREDSRGVMATKSPYQTRLAAQISGQFELRGFLSVYGDAEAELEVMVELLDCGETSTASCGSASVVAAEVVGEYEAIGETTVTTGGGGDMSVGSITGGVGGGGIDFGYGLDLLNDLITDKISFDLDAMVQRGHDYRLKITMTAEIRTGDQGGVGMVFTYFDSSDAMEALVRPQSPFNEEIWEAAMPLALRGLSLSLWGLDTAIKDFAPTMELPDFSFTIPEVEFKIPNTDFNIGSKSFGIGGRSTSWTGCGGTGQAPCPKYGLSLGGASGTLDLPKTDLSFPATDPDTVGDGLTFLETAISLSHPALFLAANAHCTGADEPDACCLGPGIGTCSPFDIKAQSILDRLGLPSDLGKLMTGFDSPVLEDDEGNPLRIPGVLDLFTAAETLQELVPLPGLKVEELSFVVEYDQIELLDLATAAIQQQAEDTRFFLNGRIVDVEVLIAESMAELRGRFDDVDGAILVAQEIEIEKALLNHTLVPNFFLPTTHEVENTGGRLEQVRDLVLLRLMQAQLAGLDVVSAFSYFTKAEEHLVDLQYLESYEDLARAFGALSGYELRQPDIERALLNRESRPSLYLPEDFGGRLELVRSVVQAWLVRAEAAGLQVQPAWRDFDNGDEAFSDEDYPNAYKEYGEAYRKINEHGGGGGPN